jgi:hypothetical protein
MRHRANCCLLAAFLLVVLVLAMLAVMAVALNGFAGM